MADRIVIFTERIETLRFLELNLARDLKLKADQLAVVHGSGIEDIDLQKIVEDFGRDRSPVRLLLARVVCHPVSGAAFRIWMLCSWMRAVSRADGSQIGPRCPPWKSSRSSLGFTNR